MLCGWVASGQREGVGRDACHRAVALSCERHSRHISSICTRDGCVAVVHFAVAATFETASKLVAASENEIANTKLKSGRRIVIQIRLVDCPVWPGAVAPSCERRSRHIFFHVHEGLLRRGCPFCSRRPSAPLAVKIAASRSTSAWVVVGRRLQEMQNRLPWLRTAGARGSRVDQRASEHPDSICDF